jgi:hypothetical protein
LRRSTGESVFTEHGAARFTTRDILDAEQRLLDTATQPTRYGLTREAAATLVGVFEKAYDLGLDEGQRALVLGFASRKRAGQRPFSVCGRCRIRTCVGIHRRIYRTKLANA